MKSLRCIVLVALGVWCLLLVLASQSTLWERDEARYGTAALEMTHTGNMLYPTFNHELRAFQPVMVYWLMSAGIHLLGENALAVRLASTIAMAMVCVLVGVIAMRFSIPGPLATGIAGTTPMLLLVGSAATTDSTLLLFILLCQATFLHAWFYGPKVWQVPVMGLSIGLAMLTKGPIGLAVPVLSIATILMLARGRSSCGPFGIKLVMAALLGILIFLAWGLPANAASGGEYWRIAIVERLPKRLFTAMEGHGGHGLLPFLAHLPFYPLVLAIGFLPWTIYMVLVRGTLVSPETTNSQTGWAASPGGLKIVILGMTLPTVILMTLIVSKLPHYTVPVFPWLAILVAYALSVSDQRINQSRAMPKLQRIFYISSIPAALLGLSMMLAPGFLPSIKTLQSPLLISGLLLLVWVVLMIGVLRRCSLRAVASIHVVAMAAWLAVTACLLMPPLEALVKPAQNLARQVYSSLPPSTQVAALGWKEPGMHFYLGAPRISYFDDVSRFEEWAAVPGPKLLIRKETQKEPVPEGFHLLGRQVGINTIHGTYLSLAAYLRP